MSAEERVRIQVSAGQGEKGDAPAWASACASGPCDRRAGRREWRRGRQPCGPRVVRASWACREWRR